jgi:hypothetical protein
MTMGVAAQLKDSNADDTFIGSWKDRGELLGFQVKGLGGLRRGMWTI